MQITKWFCQPYVGSLLPSDQAGFMGHAGGNIILKQFKDQLGGTIFLAGTPRRIISLVPSQTELLFDLGLDKEIIGITRFCVHPKEKCRQKIKIGGTKRFDFDLIDKLGPELIIGNKEENYKAGIESLRSKHPVWMSDVNTLEDAYQMIKGVGDMVDKRKEARDIVSEIRSKMKRIKYHSIIRVAYFIWNEPYMVAGKNTFIDEMLNKFGFANVFRELDRYPEVTLDRVRAADPDAIFLSSEPFPFRAKHQNRFREICPSAIVRLVDGTMFSWYGSRLRYAAAYFEKLIKDLQILRSV